MSTGYAARMWVGVHPDKSIFGVFLKYLGQNLSTHGISPHQAKVMAIMVPEALRNVPELHT